MKLSVLQMTSGPDVAANLDVADELLRQAADEGARLAVLPENFAFMGLKDIDKLAVGEVPGSGPIQDRLGELSSRLKLWIVAGTMPLKVPGSARVAAASLVYDAEGGQQARYDKIHLFDVDLPERNEVYRESANMQPGRQPVVIDTPLGRVGLSVCYDMRFPELYRTLAAEGAQILVMPSAFTVPTGQAHWEVLLRARAVENLCYVAAAAQWGRHPNGRETYGDALVADFWGRVLARRPDGVGVATAEIDLAAQAAVRASFPALRHRVL